VVVHPLIDACLEIVSARPLHAEQVRAIKIQVHPRAVDLAGIRHPDTAVKGRFSLYQAAAVALTRRAAGLAAFETADVHDTGLAGLRDLMQVEADAQRTPSEARVQVEFKDGSSLESAIDHPSGSPQRPLTDAQLRDKFSELASCVLEDSAAAALFETCMSLERLRDVSELRRHWTGIGRTA
jgi:2-methylcitrate dehydratase PrpD